MDWMRLENEEQLEGILNSSKPVVLFKHSTRCHISSMALSGFNRTWQVTPDRCDTYLLDLITYRNLSNEVAQRTGIVHHSPQVLLFKDGKVIYSASHHGIDANEIEAKLA